MAYATADDMTARFDAGVLRDLCSDTGVEVQNLSASTALTAALDDASGEINSAVMVAGLYSTDVLGDLTGVDLAFLKRLTCELAMGFMLGRRPEKYADETVERVVKNARETLQELRDGKRIFNVEATKTAGQPSIDGPTALDYRRLNMIPDRTKNYFPSRASRLPIGRG